MMRLPLPCLVVAAALAALCGPAAAQYKVVNPDGSVTYTDRPPVASNAKITPLSRRGGAPAEAAGADSELPFELRNVAARYPVTLYASPDCPPCDAARNLLQQRGVPYAERSVTTEDDAAALERAVGGRTVPSLTVGGQALRGLAAGEWASYLDAAGYPRESRLPRSWKAPAATPLVERSNPARTAVAPAAPQPQVAAPEGDGEPERAPAPGTGTTIRF